MTSFKFLNKQNGLCASEFSDTMIYLFKDRADFSARGKILYKKMCAMCHGDKGKGDGSLGVNLSPRPADLTSSHVQSMSDSALFWIITKGKPPMPGYRDSLNDNERWKLVKYIREFEKGNKIKK